MPLERRGDFTQRAPVRSGQFDGQHCGQGSFVSEPVAGSLGPTARPRGRLLALAPTHETMNDPVGQL
jgi:hypothetical protein